MNRREDYKPGAAAGADVRKEGGNWTLIVVRELRHPPEKVWHALIEPEQLREWAPFDADRSLGSVGPVNLSTVGTLKSVISHSRVTRVEASSVLEFQWGDQELRWLLEPLATGTRLTLWHKIDRRYISMGAAGWHICLDVLDRCLGDSPIGRIVAGDAMQFDWPRLNTEYAKQFGIEPPQPPPGLARN